MENEKLYPKEKQKGVVFYRNKLASQDMSENPEGIDAIDIDVDDEVKEVVICYDLIMPDSKKSFPNVESLVIKSNVFEIRIPNSLFPNLKETGSRPATALFWMKEIFFVLCLTLSVRKKGK